MSIDTTDLEIELQESLTRLDTCISKFMDTIHKHIHTDNKKVDILSNVSNIMTKLAETKHTLKSNIDKINSGIHIYDEIYVNIFNTKRPSSCGVVSKMIVPNIYTHVVEVETLDAIPNIPLCYVKSLGQFAIKINETIIRGNVGDISQHNNIPCIQECENETCSSPTCNKWHDPYKHEYLNYYFEDNSNYTKKQIRNFGARSWMYSPKKYINNMRHIGSRNSLHNDVHFIDKVESNLIIGQTMHDILTCITIAKNSTGTVGIENIYKK